MMRRKLRRVVSVGSWAGALLASLLCGAIGYQLGYLQGYSFLPARPTAATIPAPDEILRLFHASRQSE